MEMSQLLQQLGSMPPDQLEKIMQEMPPELRQGMRQMQQMSGSTAAPGGPRDLRKAAEKEAPAVYAEVLGRYCQPDVARQYRQLPPEAQGKFLKALRVTVEEGAQQLSMEKLMSQTAGGLAKARGAVSKDCPIMKALGLVSQMEYDAQEIDALKQILKTWGQRLPRPMLLMKHMAGCKQRTSRESNEVITYNTNSTLAKPEQETRNQPRRWDALRTLGISSLRLFEVATGGVLVGKLIVPPSVTVGITTILEDQSGEVLQLGLYNQLPGGVTGIKAQDFAEKLFPEGATLHIAEPFLKIFRDGNQGVRVDSPHDIRVERSEAHADLSDFRLKGNEFFVAKEFEAALTLYWQGLQGCGELAVLLSNRAQAQLKQEKWCEALRDSAASWLLCPSGAKHKARYAAALQGLGFEAAAKRAQDLTSDQPAPLPPLQETRSALRMGLKAELTTCGVTAEDCSSLKEKGNAAFKGARYDEASAFYTQALDKHPLSEEAANLLRNAALCSTRAGRLHDAVAAASASLRLRLTAKGGHHLAHALALLGELEMSQGVLDFFPDSEPGFRQLSKDLALAAEHLRLNYPAEVVTAATASREWPGKLLVEWISDAICCERITGKGRGVHALRAIEFGETLMVQRPRARAAADAQKDGELLTSTNTDSGVICSASQVKLAAQLTTAAGSDQLLAKVLSSLDDGSGKERPVVSLDSLLDGLQPSVLPLLRQHSDFYPKAERLELSNACVRGVVDVNTHGGSTANTQNFLSRKAPEQDSSSLLAGDTNLYPAVSMINHSGDPTGVLLPLFKDGELIGMAVSARKYIPKTAELTLAYLDDPEHVKAKWGIES